MFELGRLYTITTGHGDEIGYSTSQVLAWNFPLLKVKTPTGELIINTASPNFVSAEMKD